MTREFNQKPRYDSRPPYRGSSSNKRYGAEQPSGPTRRLNRAMVDRAWENGAPHRHADYKPRHPNEAGAHQTNYGPNSQRNWHKTQPSEYPSGNHAPHERGESKRPARYQDAYTPSHRSDYSSNGHQGARSHTAQPNNRPPYRDQRGNGNEENTYRARNGHPNFSHTPQEANRGRNNQERGQQESHRNGAYSHRTNPTNQVSNPADRRDRRHRPYDQHETSYHDNHFEGRHRANFNEPRYPATPNRQRENGGHQQFEGDYEQFNRATSRQPRDGRRQEERQPQNYTKRMEKPPEAKHHVTPLPDGRVLKGPRPAQRKNAQFWTDISQDTEKLVNQVQAPEETADKAPDEQAQTGTLPVPESAPAPHIVSPRAKIAKRVASAARKGRTERPVSSGPRPSQRGFKWPASPSQS
jgi:hypothetical protein